MHFDTSRTDAGAGLGGAPDQESLAETIEWLRGRVLARSRPESERRNGESGFLVGHEFFGL